MIRIVITTISILVGLQLTLLAQEVQDQFFETDGVTIRYQIVGEGPPVILLHGYMSNIDHTWENVIPLLAEDYMVIAMDLRGHGQSSKPESVEAYGLKMGQDVIELMDYLGIEQAHFAGYSMGTMIGLKLATEYQNRFLSLISGGNGFFDREAIARINEHYSQILNQFMNLEEALLNGLFSIQDEFRGHLHKHVKQNDIQAMRDVVNSLEELAMTRQEAETISIPITVIIGENDSSISTAIDLFYSNPATRIIPIPGRHHLDIFYDPEFAIQIKRFLDDIYRIIDKKG